MTLTAHRPARLAAPLLVLAAVAAACSSSDTASPTTGSTSTLAVVTTTAAVTATNPLAPPPDYAAPGPLAVASQLKAIPDDGEGRPVPVTLWYPDDDDGAPFPLLVLSHGLGGDAAIYTDLAEHLASYGFVVIGADHDDRFNGDAEATAALLYDRPHDIVREIAFADELTGPGGELTGLIDTDHIGVLGHSTGGTTVFQAGGARVDFDAEAAFCADKDGDPFAAEACQFIGQRDVLAAEFGDDATSTGLLPAVADPRVDALVAMAPGGELQVFGEDGIGAVNVPTLILQGAADEFLSLEYNAYWAYNHIGSSNKALAVFEGGSHLMFLDCCGYDASAGGPRFEDLYPHLATAFLLDNLKGDPVAHAALAPDAVDIDGVTFTTHRSP